MTDRRKISLSAVLEVVIGSIIMGILVFGETLNILGWAFLAVVVVGVLGLNMVTESEGDGKS